MPQTEKMANGLGTLKREPLNRESSIRCNLVTIQRITGSIHIPLVTLVAFQLLDVFVGLIDAFAALLLDNLAQGCIHVLGHATRVTAHKKLCALGIDPFPDL